MRQTVMSSMTVNTERKHRSGSISTTIHAAQTEAQVAVPGQSTYATKFNALARSENTDVVPYPIFLVLCYALGDPSDVPNFL